MKWDFSGYATKNNIKCSDGREILHNAFADNDGQIVPLVWQHMHNEPNNVLGHAKLENRDDGVYAFGKFNGTTAGQNAKELVKHGDIRAMSIFANNLKQKGNKVLQGSIKEVSLVLSGANPGALIDNLELFHADDGSVYTDPDAAIIYSGENLDTEEEEENVSDDLKHEDKKQDEKTVGEILDTFTEEQKNVLYYLVGEATNEEETTGDVKHSDEDYDEEDNNMKHNVFEDTNEVAETLSHDEFSSILTDAKNLGSFKESLLMHAEDYGITNIETLFPDAKLVGDNPELISRNMDWVSTVLNGTKHSPFSRIKSIIFDITAEEARAKGYVKGSLKTDEVIKAGKRVTTPKTIYKKQKLDRDDLIDITDMNVVAWIKQEMRIMLNEEIARAILFGDGREEDDPDKINEDNIRPIVNEHELFAYKTNALGALTPNVTDAGDVISNFDNANALADAIITGMVSYKGSGNTTLFLDSRAALAFRLGRNPITQERVFKTNNDIALACGVKNVVVMEFPRNDVAAIVVDLKDYTVGADKGGAIALFDDFDIDYNQYKYLLETRMSGALTKPYSALVVPATLGNPEDYNLINNEFDIMTLNNTSTSKGYPDRA